MDVPEERQVMDMELETSGDGWPRKGEGGVW